MRVSSFRSSSSGVDRLMEIQLHELQQRIVVHFGQQDLARVVSADRLVRDLASSA